VSLAKEFIYAICLLASFACTGLLYRGYRRTGMRLLLWSALCFVFLSINNTLLLLHAFLPSCIDLRIYRAASSLLAVTVLLAGFLWEME
jgi:hypothetical protein